MCLNLKAALSIGINYSSAKAIWAEFKRNTGRKYSGQSETQNSKTEESPTLQVPRACNYRLSVDTSPNILISSSIGGQI